VLAVIKLELDYCHCISVTVWNLTAQGTIIKEKRIKENIHSFLNLGEIYVHSFRYARWVKESIIAISAQQETQPE